MLYRNFLVQSTGLAQSVEGVIAGRDDLFPKLGQKNVSRIRWAAGDTSTSPLFLMYTLHSENCIRLP